jgi:hypothetical protein
VLAASGLLTVAPAKVVGAGMPSGSVLAEGSLDLASLLTLPNGWAPATHEPPAEQEPPERDSPQLRPTRRTLLAMVNGTQRPGESRAGASAPDDGPSSDPVAVVAPRHRVPSRPVRPPARMPPLRFPPVEQPTRGDEWERAWHELRALRRIEDSPSSAREGARTAVIAQVSGDLIGRVQRSQAAGAALVALVAAGLAVSGQADGALWALALVLVASGGAALSYLLHQRCSVTLLAGVALLGSQLGVLAWAFALYGARVALLAFVPALSLLMLRLAGRGLAVAGCAVSFMLYLAFTAAQMQGIVSPLLAIGEAPRIVLDAALVAAGLLLCLLAILDQDAGRMRALDQADVRLREATEQHAKSALLQSRVRQDAERMRDALAGALHGQRGDAVSPLVAHAALQELAELIDGAGARLETLHRDREDRVRLEGAIRQAVHAVERIEMGRAPHWPEPTGTLMDALVAQLRALHPGAAILHPTAYSHRGLANGATPAPRAAWTRPTGIILPWRPSGKAEHAQMPSAWVAWQPVRPDDDDPPSLD